MTNQYVKLSESQIQLLEPFRKSRFTAISFSERHNLSIKEAQAYLDKLQEEQKLNLTYDYSDTDFRKQLKFYSVPFGINHQITKYLKDHE